MRRLYAGAAIVNVVMLWFAMWYGTLDLALLTATSAVLCIYGATR